MVVFEVIWLKISIVPLLTSFPLNKFPVKFIKLRKINYITSEEIKLR